MLKRLRITFKILFFISIFLTSSKAEILKPNSNIKPSEVVKIQLSGLQKNDLEFKDSGIEQTWNFAHPNNKKVTGGDGVTKASTDGVIIDAYIAGASADLLLPLISSDSPITTSDELLTHLLEIA